MVGYFCSLIDCSSQRCVKTMKRRHGSMETIIKRILHPVSSLFAISVLIGILFLIDLGISH
jgi:lipopolysaccharide/colanic/teichoic acid biosynthesis glycosyltransferase